LGNVILYIAASLDGFIADRDGGVGWLDAYQAADYGYEAFLDTVGTVIMGAATYEQVLTFGPWPYAGKATYVFTHRPLPKADPANIDLYAGTPAILVHLIRSASDRNIWLVGGARLVAAFLNAGLVDEIRLFVIPTLLGAGIPLFRDITAAPGLDLLDSRPYPNGVVELHYAVRRAE
jgi:dihydrofolate reductase